MNIAKSICAFLFLFTFAETVSDKNYALLPELFLQDNFDKCMLLEDEALYCSFEYRLESIDDEKNPTWTTIREISTDNFNYKHDTLRHWICVPLTCLNSTEHHRNANELKNHINKCYDQKMINYKLKGTIHNLKCATNDTKFHVDSIDIVVAIVLTSYMALTILLTLCEAVANNWWRKTFANTYQGKILSCFSLTKNWLRLTTINNDSSELDYLRPLQGVRSLNTFLVIFSHTCLAAVMSPVANTKYTETMNSKYSNLLLSSGPLCVSTFFLISSIMLSYGIFKRKRLTVKMSLVVLVNRYIRLTPALAAIVSFNSTWWRHLGTGPNWHHLIGREYSRCRKNWWTNLLYLNTVIDPYNMCTPTLWYMAEDTQYFVLSLMLLWFIRKYERRIWFILGGCLLVNVVATFVNNYVNDFEGLNVPRPESVYDMKNIVENPLWHGQFISTIGNSCGPIFGIGFGYLFHRNKNAKPFENRKTTWKILFYVFTYIPALLIVVVPSWSVLIARHPHHPVTASLIAATGRPVFLLAVGFFLFGSTHGLAGPADYITRWRPIYILGRVAYGAYLVHFTIILTRTAVSRSPTYISDALIIYNFFGDLTTSYLIGCCVTLFFEMPISALQKLLIPTYIDNDGKKKER